MEQVIIDNILINIDKIRILGYQKNYSLLNLLLLLYKYRKYVYEKGLKQNQNSIEALINSLEKCLC